MQNITRIIPINARIGAKELGFNRFTKIFEPSIPAKDKIQAVTVVPILAPIIMPITCLNAIMPLFTKPTAITVTAPED